jgi:hypothetical protein
MAGAKSEEILLEMGQVNAGGPVNLKDVAQKRADFEAAKKVRAQGTAISVDLKDYPELLVAIRAAAKAEDREVANWLRRRLVQLDEAGTLFGKEV